jgi:ADP-L-glycero-D-manno-heptose 6-epimerase
MDLNYKTILITGGAGFIGSNLALELEREYPFVNVVIFDSFRGNNFLSNGNHRSLGHYKNLLEFKGIIIQGSITDDAALENLFGTFVFDAIFHFAAISDTTVNEQDIVIEANVNAYRSILKKAIEQKSTLVYASSAATYGNLPNPQTVGNEAPLNVYGFSKLVMDNLSTKYYNSGINIVGLRFFNVYGRSEFYKGNSASVILQLGLQILQGKRPKLFKGSDKIYRDFIYIEDVISCCKLALKSNKSGIYNVGTGLPRTFQDVFDVVKIELNSHVEPEYIDNIFSKQYQFYTQANILDTMLDLGFKPIYTLEQGIRNYTSDIINLFKDEF